ncbi:hypothetical protein JYK22_22195 [Nonomuraea sp. RK-328]|nr:hypothetical protein [Nonomuraea sp. RK-328]
MPPSLFPGSAPWPVGRVPPSLFSGSALWPVGRVPLSLSLGSAPWSPGNVVRSRLLSWVVWSRPLPVVSRRSARCWACSSLTEECSLTGDCSLTDDCSPTGAALTGDAGWGPCAVSGEPVGGVVAYVAGSDSSRRRSMSTVLRLR